MNSKPCVEFSDESHHNLPLNVPSAFMKCMISRTLLLHRENSFEPVKPVTYTLPELSIAMALADSSLFPPKKVAALIELRSDGSFATKASLLPLNVLSADPAFMPGKVARLRCPLRHRHFLRGIEFDIFNLVIAASSDKGGCSEYC